MEGRLFSVWRRVVRRAVGSAIFLECSVYVIVECCPGLCRLTMDRTIEMQLYTESIVM